MRRFGLTGAGRGRRLAPLLSLIGVMAVAACAGSPYQPPQTHSHTAQPAPSGQPGPVQAGRPYQVRGVWYTPIYDPNYDVVGVASWYGRRFHGRRTASGALFDMNALSAAHRTLPFGTLVEVTNLANGRAVNLVINDRGPFVRGRVIDVSHHVAGLLGFRGQGTARVRVRVIGAAKG